MEITLDPIGKDVPASARLNDFRAHFGNIPWPTVLKYAVIGTTAAGATYYLAQRFQTKNCTSEQKRTVIPKDGKDLPQPMMGPLSTVGQATPQEISSSLFADHSLISTAVVSQLCIYPIKSCRGILVNSFHCGEMGPEINTEHGIVRDRTWMVTTANYVFITQRKRPKMSLIVPSINGSKLEINAPGMPTLKVPLSINYSDYKRVGSAVFGDKIDGVDLGDEPGAWFAEYLDQPGARLIYHPHDFGGRELSSDGTAEVEVWKSGDKCVFADGAPYLLLSEESVEECNTRLDEPITWNNFRPNILVSGCSPYAEDKWRNFSIGDASFRNAKLCTRCTLTTVDPQSGTLSRKDILQTLKTYRVNQTPEWQTVYEKHPLMAVNLGIDRVGNISIGDPILQCS